MSAKASYLGISKHISFPVVFVSDCNSDKTLGKKIWWQTLANNADEYFRND